MERHIECEINTEYLIYLVEERPCLWDRTQANYNQKIVTVDAWNDVCRLLRFNFQSLSEEDKNEFSQSIIKRWKNLRDSYLKSLKKPLAGKKAGATATFVKKYVFHDQLQFLNKNYNPRSKRDSGYFIEESIGVESKSDEETSGCTEDILGIINGNEIAEEITPEPSQRIIKKEIDYFDLKRNGGDNVYEIITDDHLATSSAEDNVPAVPSKPIQRGVKRKYDDIEVRLLKALEKLENPNPHLSFFNSILPTLNNLTPSQTLDFQFDVLKALKNITSK